MQRADASTRANAVARTGARTRLGGRHADHVVEVPARGRGEAAHERAVLHEALAGGRVRHELVVVEGGDAKERGVRRRADVRLRAGQGWAVR